MRDVTNRWRFCAAAIAIAAAAGMLPAGAQPASQPRIVAVGDVHGDFDQFVKILRAARVINDKNDWSAGKAVLVQTGDVLDRAPDSRKAVDLLMKLEAQAPKAGGAVHSLVGNHEAMVVCGDWRYVHPGEFMSFGGEREFRKAMSPTGKYGKWLCGNQAVVQVGDTIFVHGGLVFPTAKLSLKEINRAVRAEMVRGRAGPMTMGMESPLWDRSLAIGDPDEAAAQLKKVLARYGARRMVVGHTVTRDGVVTRAGGRLIRIDVGMSNYYRGPAACLVIENGVAYEIRPGRKNRRLADAPATQPASQPASRPVAVGAAG